MTEKTKQIITTVIGAIVVAIGSILTVSSPHAASYFVPIAGALNEALNIILQKFVKPKIDTNELLNNPQGTILY